MTRTEGTLTGAVTFMGVSLIVAWLAVLALVVTVWDLRQRVDEIEHWRSRSTPTRAQPPVVIPFPRGR